MDYELSNYNKPEEKTKISKLGALGLIITIAVLIGGFYFWAQRSPQVTPEYSQIYRLVPEKISQSAAIVIHLPVIIDKALAQSSVKFDPEIKGQWVQVDDESIIAFKPKEKLNLGRYYSVELTYAQSPETIIKEDFLAVEDPEIIAIFPSDGSEAPETSEITIVFNRPMVPLTTLGYLEKQDVPVEITPHTEGRFKWITTRNLQFIPEKALNRSSNYTIKINSGLVSIDGLEVKGQERNFVTRKLRYYSLSNGETPFNRPISIYFNQPVDLEKTKGEITLRNNNTGKEIPFIAEYATNEKSKSANKGYGKESWSFGSINVNNLVASIASQLSINWPFDIGSQEEQGGINESIIKVYPKEDRFGREKFWDFENNYSLTIKKAYPTEGDIILEESRSASINVPNIIQSITAESERTNWAAADFFDPQGKLWVSFYEEIDLDKSKITAHKLKEIGYGEKCKDDSLQLSSSVECEKVEDKARIYMIFNSEDVGLGEKIELVFEEVVNVEGLTINKDPVKRYAVSYPEFKILSVQQPSSYSNSRASLTGLTLCTNSPIAAPDKEDYENYLKANLDYELNYWPKSYRVIRKYSSEKCQVGEFRTSIGYGLMPLSDYSFEFNLEDVFSQKLKYNWQLTTAEMPNQYLYFYQLQPSYNVTSPEKTTLTFAVQNMEYVNLEICKLSAKSLLYYIENRPSYYYDPSAISGCQEIKKDTIELPNRYWIKNYFKVNLEDYFDKDPIGHYILTFHNPNYIESWKKRQIYQRSYLTVTNLSVAEKKIQPQYATYGANQPLSESQIQDLNNMYWVTDISTLNPVFGAMVNIYREKSDNLIFTGSYVTDNQGIAFTPIVYDLAGAVISNGEDSTIIPSRQSRLEWVDYAFSSDKIYLYADKAIYRPTQEVAIKGIYRLGYDGNYEIYTDEKVNLKVYSSRGDEILSKDLEVSDFGTFDTKLALEEGAPLGTYRACISNYNCAYFDVEEYIAAAFKVEVISDKEEYVSKDTVNLTVDADYYFGVPLEGGEVSYTISSQSYYFDRYPESRFSFGSYGYYYWLEPEEKMLLRGKASLNSEGEAQISQLIDFQSLFKDKEDRKSKIIVVDVTVKNSQGQSISAQKSFIVHAGDFYLGLKADKSFLAKNEKTNIAIKSVDIDGKELKQNNVTLNLYKIKWNRSKRLGSDGGYQYTWEKEKELVKSYHFNTDGQGNYIQEIQIGEEGSYEAEVWAYDKRNNIVWTTKNIYVYGEKSVSIRPTTDTSLELEANKLDLNVSEEGEIIIKSPYSEAKALISIERGDVFDYEIVDIKGNLYKYSFKVEENYAPNVYVSVFLVSSKPEIKFGKVEFKINTERKELNIEVKSNKANYLPGEEVTLDITAKDYLGRPKEAELSIAVVDLSVLALKGNPKKDPLVFFYSGFPLTVSTASNIKNILTEVDVPTKGGDGYAEANSLGRKKRGEFRDTAFWQAAVVTDSSGKAQVKFTLPDNLTTWQAEILGVTKDTKLGVDYQEFITKKELMVVPLKPRFVVPGDVFLVGGKVFNQSDKKQKLEIEFSSPTLNLRDNVIKKVTINKDKTDTIYFEVEAPSQIEFGEHVFTLSAKNSDLEDTVEMPISITRNNTYEVTATANYTSEDTSKEYVFLPDNVVKDRGELSIKSSATLAVFLSDGLNYLLQFPYGCSEQISSRLNAIAIVKKGLNVPNLSDKFNLEKIKYQEKEYTVEEAVNLGLAELYNNQESDGGFSYWGRRGYSSFYVTLHVVDALYNLSLAGFEINQNSLDRASNYLYKKVTTDRMIYQNKNNVILTAHTLFRMSNFDNRSVLTQQINSIANDDLFINDQISNTSLAYLANLLTEGFDSNLKNKIFTVLDNRIDIDSRGAFLERGRNFFWQYYETPVKNTSLYLKAQVANKSDNKILDKVLRWILNSREKDGAWGSTNNTLCAVDALTEFLKWKRETESSFNFEMLINGKKEGEFEFNSETILDQFKKEISLNEIEFNKNNTILLQKTNRNNLPNNLYYDISLKYYLPADTIPPRDEGFSIVREFYSLDDKENKTPLLETKVGDILRGHIQITVPATRNFATIEDYIPAGMEIVNLNLATEEKSLRLQETELKGREFVPEYEEIRDDRLFLYKESLMPGLYEFDYYVRALIPGKFTHLPAVVSEMYFPENFGRTSGGYFEIK